MRIALTDSVVLNATWTTPSRLRAPAAEHFPELCSSEARPDPRPRKVRLTDLIAPDKGQRSVGDDPGASTALGGVVGKRA